MQRPYTETLAPGSILETNNNAFEIKGILGSGSFGITYLSTVIKTAKANMVVGQSVAIKEFFPRLTNFTAVRDPYTGRVSLQQSNRQAVFDERREEFIREASYLNQLRKIDNIVTFLFCGIDIKHNSAFFVMELLDGHDLEHASSQYSPEQIRYFLYRLLEALQTLHTTAIKTNIPIIVGDRTLRNRHSSHDRNACYISHLDIKPANIMLHNNEPYLIDFGIAEGVMSGGCTERFAPLEQIYNQKALIGPRSDFYALGATFYWLLTRQLIPVSKNRVGQADPYIPLVNNQQLVYIYGYAFLHAIDAALRVESGSRWATAQHWINYVFPNGCPPKPHTIYNESRKADPAPIQPSSQKVSCSKQSNPKEIPINPPSTHDNKTILILILILSVMLLILMLLIILV